jgi:hypothetical protein
MVTEFNQPVNNNLVKSEHPHRMPHGVAALEWGMMEASGTPALCGFSCLRCGAVCAGTDVRFEPLFLMPLVVKIFRRLAPGSSSQTEAAGQRLP